MSAPRMNPSGTVDVVSHATMNGKIEVFGYGQDPRAVSPGDLLLVSTNWMRENAKSIQTEFVLKLRGRDIDYFVDHALIAQSLWHDNKHWLQAPMNQVGLDCRSKSEVRVSDVLDTLDKYLSA